MKEAADRQYEKKSKKSEWRSPGVLSTLPQHHGAATISRSGGVRLPEKGRVWLGWLGGWLERTMERKSATLLVSSAVFVLYAVFCGVLRFSRTASGFVASCQIGRVFNGSGFLAYSCAWLSSNQFKKHIVQALVRSSCSAAPRLQHILYAAKLAYGSHLELKSDSH